MWRLWKYATLRINLLYSQVFVKPVFCLHFYVGPHGMFNFLLTFSPKAPKNLSEVLILPNTKWMHLMCFILVKHLITFATKFKHAPKAVLPGANKSHQDITKKKSSTFIDPFSSLDPPSLPNRPLTSNLPQNYPPPPLGPALNFIQHAPLVPTSTSTNSLYSTC